MINISSDTFFIGLIDNRIICWMTGRGCITMILTESHHDSQWCSIFDRISIALQECLSEYLYSF